MKSLLLTIFLGFSTYIFATTYTTVQDGNWANPTVWDASGVPNLTLASDDTVLIEHNVNALGSITVKGCMVVNDSLYINDKLSVNSCGKVIINGFCEITNNFFMELNCSSCIINGSVVMKGNLNVIVGSNLTINGYLLVENGLELEAFTTINGSGDLDVCGGFEIEDSSLEGTMDVCSCDSVTNPIASLEGDWNIDSTVTICNPTLSANDWMSFSGHQKKETHMLNWEVSNSNDINYFIVQHSKNGINFKEIGKVSISNPNTLKYNFTTDMNDSEKHYYKIERISNSEEKSFSKVIILNNEDKKLVIHNIYPNPANNYLSMSISNITGNDIGVEIYNMLGENLLKLDLENYNSKINTTLNINQLSTGTFLLLVTDYTNSTSVSQLFQKR